MSPNTQGSSTMAMSITCFTERREGLHFPPKLLTSTFQELALDVAKRTWFLDQEAWQRNRHWKWRRSGSLTRKLMLDILRALLGRSRSYVVTLGCSLLRSRSFVAKMQAKSSCHSFSTYWHLRKNDRLPTHWPLNISRATKSANRWHFFINVSAN